MANKRPTTRRDFLTGRSAARAAEDLAECALPGADANRTDADANRTDADATLPGASKDASDSVRDGAGPQQARESPSESYLLSFTRQAMACQFAIYLNPGQYDDATDTILEALDRVERLEDQLTVYRERSELQDINRLAAERDVQVESGLFGLLRMAAELHELTDGALDISSGPLSSAWGFSRRAGKMPSDEQVREALGRVGASDILLDAERRTVRFARPNLEINVNAIGKGYALDVCARILRERGVDDFLFHGGQSSLLAAGVSAATPSSGWTVGLRHPMRPERRLAEFDLCDRALGTSGSGTQFFHFQGKRYGHILDPRTGRPAEGVFSATVLAPTAAEADALATAFYVLGPEGAERICKRREDIGAVLVTPGHRATTVALSVFGMEDTPWRRLSE